MPLVAHADVIVKNTAELRGLLQRDADLGTVLLDGEEFDIENLTVKAGAVIRPYGHRKPLFVGRRIGLAAGDVQVNGFGRQDFVVTDAALKAFPVAQRVLGVKISQVERVDSVQRRIRIDLHGTMPAALKGKGSKELSRCTLKLSFWFVCMDVTGLSADDHYVYGTVDNDYNYGKLSAPYYDFATLCFFNLPQEGDAMYIDGNSVAHVPAGAGKLTLHLCGKGLTLEGKRPLTIDGVTFVGLSEAVTIKSYTAANKTISNCTFMHCGQGVYSNSNLSNVKANISVTGCTFNDMYGSVCVLLYGCDNSVIAHNTTHRTGLLNKGAAVISAAGDRVHIFDNRVSSFSYNGIRMGHTREFGRMRIAGIVEDNYIDNSEYHGRRDLCLADGGGINVPTHQDSTIIRNNVICNVGFMDGDVRGIFMDDGAYNTTVSGNLIFNVMDSYCIDSRLVTFMANIDIAHHNGNNHFIDNVCLGTCRLHGHTGDIMDASTASGNYVSGQVQDNGHMLLENTVKLEATATGKGIKVSRNTYRSLKRVLSPFVMKWVKK